MRRVPHYQKNKAPGGAGCRALFYFNQQISLRHHAQAESNRACPIPLNAEQNKQPR
jgi:hypothetical protein